MRLDELSSLPRLSLEQVRNALAGADVRGMLPVTDLRTMREHILVATPRGLAVVTSRVGDGSTLPSMVVDWAHWSLVRLGLDSERDGAAEESRLEVIVRVGRSAFRAFMQGPAGQEAQRAFVVALQRGIAGNLAYADYDAAEMLTH